MIIVMDQGRVVEMGSPSNLLARPLGHFRRLAVENGAISDGGSGAVNDGDQIEIAP